MNPSTEEQHARQVIGSFVGLNHEELPLLKKIPKTLQDLLLRTEELSTDVDQWGNFEHSYAKNYQEGHLWNPEVDLFAQEERTRLHNDGHPLTPLWPSGYTFALVLTHDVDHLDLMNTYPLLFRRLSRAMNSLDLTKKEKIRDVLKTAAQFILRKGKMVQNAEKTLEESLRIERKLGVKASYFFTVYPLETISRYDCLYSFSDKIVFRGKKTPLCTVLQQMQDDGFDVGLHGSYFSALDAALLIKQKKALGFLKNEIETTRQHWLHFRLPTTLQYQNKAGLKVDTTLGYNRNIGYRAGTGFPFKLFDNQTKQAIPVLEIPMIIQDGALLGTNALEYSVNKSLEVITRFLHKTQETNGCLTLLFHPDIFLKEGLSSLYEATIRLALEQGAWVTDAKTLARYWEQRNQTLGYL